jgi:hypothetical protein
MASQYPNRDPTMHIPKDILPQFESLRIALGRESKSDVLRWVFAMCAPHIQAVLKSSTGTSTSSGGASNQGGQTVIDLSQDSEVPAFFQSLGKMVYSPPSKFMFSITISTFNTSLSFFFFSFLNFKNTF